MWSFIKENNKAGAGGIVRNKNGDLIMAFANPTQFYTNNFSEAHVALIGISWCCNNHIQNIEMELDSMIIVNMIKGNAKPSCLCIGIFFLLGEK